MRYAFMFLLALIILSCSRQAEPTITITGPVEYSLHSLSGYDSLPSDNVNIIITDTSFTGQGPVNRYFGQITAGRIGPVGSTMMAGEQVLMDFEHKYFTAMDAGNVDGAGSDTLKIRKDKVAVVVFVKK